MTIRLICPYCRFSKEVSKEKIPAAAKRALCPRCGQRFPLSPSGEDPGLAPEKGPRRRGAPWEERPAIGLWQGIYQTFKAVLFSPERLFGTMTFTDGIREPLAFGLLIGSVGSMFGLFWQFLALGGGLSFLDLQIDNFGRLTIGFLFLSFLIIIPIFVTVGMFLYSAVLQFLLLIVRGGKNGYEATFRVVSYSQAAQALGLIPIIGGWIGGIWQLIVQVIGLRQIHETSYLRVILAFLIPAALFFLLVIAVLIPLLIYLFGNAAVY